MKDFTVESMLPDTHVTVSMSIDCRGLNASDQRRIIVHASGEVVHQVLSTRGVNPLGLVVTTELVENVEWEAPRIRIAATAPRYVSEPVFGL